MRAVAASAIGPISAVLCFALGLTVLVRAVSPPASRRLGWILLVGALANGVWYIDPSNPATSHLHWLELPAGALAVTSLVVLLAIFPIGRAGGKRAPLIGSALLAGGLLAMRGTEGLAGGVLLALVLAAVMAALGIRFGRASGLDRGQTGWVLGVTFLATSVSAVAIATGSADWQVAARACIGVGVPAGLAIAVVRFRAFGIYRFVGIRTDYWIWKTSSLIVTGAIAVTLALTATWALGWSRHPAAVALLTLVGGSALLPLLRRRVAVIDRRFTESGMRFDEHGGGAAGQLERFAAGIKPEDMQMLRGPVFELAERFATAVVVEGEGGMRFALPTADREIGRQTFIHGAYDMPPMLRAVEALAAHEGRERPLEGRVVVDVGAQVGTSLVPMLVLFGAQRGIAIEPSPQNLEFLAWNLLLNGLQERVTVVAAAASDRPGVLPLELSVAGANWGDNRLRPPGRSEAPRAAPRVDVPVMRLDDALSASGVEPVDVGLVWMDVQGYEGHVLAGAPSLVETGVPIVAEFWPSVLREADGLDRFLAIAHDRYGQFVDLRSEDRRPRPMAQLDDLVALLDREDRFTDILLLTGRQRGSASTA